MPAAGADTTDNAEQSHDSMRVCLFTPTFLPAMGGAERTADVIVRGLTERGHFVGVLAQHGPDRNADAAFDAAAPYPVRRYARPPAQHLWPGRLVRPLRAANNAWAFDVVLSFYAYPTGYAATRAAKDLGVKVVVTPRGADLYPNFHALRKPNVKRTIARGYADADRIASPSRWLTMRIVRVTGRTAEQLPPIDAVPNGIDLAAFDASLASANRGTLPLTENQKFLLHLGRVAPVKRVPMAIRAVAYAADRFRAEGVAYALVGDGPDLDSVRRLVQDLGIGDVVYVLGRRDGPEKFWLLKQALGFVSTSREEGMPNALLEAMAAGLPTLASDIGPHEELIGDHEPGTPDAWGLLCESTNAVDWGIALQGLLEAPHHAMRAAAVKLREQYTLQRTIDGYEASLRAALR